MNTKRMLIAVMIVFLVASGVIISKQESHKAHSPVPLYNEDYAFDVILKYESFGPKVPGSTEHQQAGDWIVDDLKKRGLTVFEQRSTATTFDQKTIPIRNIIAQWNPSASTRYLLSAHWDNRPYSDNDPNEKNKEKPVPGVNDGGSGVAILMGIANALTLKPIQEDFGIDFAFWDAEDWGTPSIPESYCLGSQYWSANRVPARYEARFGINYDMVGRKGSVFPIEKYSNEKARFVVAGIRSAAQKLGYLDFFPASLIGPVVDDHYFVSEKTNIPYMDIVYMTPQGRFSPEWHTTHDTSEFISRDVLKIVAQTTLQFIWDFSPEK